MKQVIGISEKELLEILYDIVAYLKNNNESPKIMQSIISVANLFQGYIVINWFDMEYTIKFHIANRIIVKACVLFYNTYQLQCNEILYSKEKQHKFLIKWCKKSKDYGKSIGGEALKFIKAYKIDETKESNQVIKEQIRKVQYYVKIKLNSISSTFGSF